jgi:hypothetical protein
VNFIDGVVALGLQMIGKLRADANLRYRYTGPRRPGPGAPKRFDGKVDWADLSRFHRIDTDDNDVSLYQQRLYHPHFKRTLNVVVVVDSRGRTPRQRILFSTDLGLEAVTLYRYYRARFQIEIYQSCNLHKTQRWMKRTIGTVARPGVAHAMPAAA